MSRYSNEDSCNNLQTWPKSKSASAVAPNHHTQKVKVTVTGIHRILTHEETGHLKSFSRDKAVRKWCKHRNIPIIEYNQTGVTRCLSSRDDFSKLFQTFLKRPLWNTPSVRQRIDMKSRLLVTTATATSTSTAAAGSLKLYNQCRHPLYPHHNKNHLPEIPEPLSHYFCTIVVGITPLGYPRRIPVGRREGGSRRISLGGISLLDT